MSYKKLNGLETQSDVIECFLIEIIVNIVIIILQSAVFILNGEYKNKKLV